MKDMACHTGTLRALFFGSLPSGAKKRFSGQTNVKLV